jgi:hypothetical protein
MYGSLASINQNIFIMKTFVKNYIGKGKKVNNLPIVRVTISEEEFSQFIYEIEGRRYLSFDVSEMKQPDKYGRTHTAYVSTNGIVPEDPGEDFPDFTEEPKKKKTTKK